MHFVDECFKWCAFVRQIPHQLESTLWNIRSGSTFVVFCLRKPWLRISVQPIVQATSQIWGLQKAAFIYFDLFSIYIRLFRSRCILNNLWWSKSKARTSPPVIHCTALEHLKSYYYYIFKEVAQTMKHTQIIFC